MVKKVFTGAAGQSETGDVVLRWLNKQGIDATMVTGYSIFEHVGEIPRIMLEMYFDDSPPAIPADCPAPTLCVDCPGRQSGDVSRCVHRPGSSDVSRETSEPAHDGEAAQGRDIHTPRNEEGN